MAEGGRTINVGGGGDYVEGDKVAGDKVMGNKVDKQVSIGGNVSGSNINLGDNVSQSIAPDNRNLEDLLTELSELIKSFPDSDHKQQALVEFNTVKAETDKAPEERNNLALNKTASYLPDLLESITQPTPAVTAAINIAKLIKKKLFG